MTADDSRAVPDTEVVREALAWFREDSARVDQVMGGERIETVVLAQRHAATIVRAYLAAQGVELDGDAPDFPDHETIGKVRREVARSTERNEFGAYIKTPVLRRIADLAERAVLARPDAGRDLTEADVRDVLGTSIHPDDVMSVAERLNRIARGDQR